MLDKDPCTVCCDIHHSKAFCTTWLARKMVIRPIFQEHRAFTKQLVLIRHPSEVLLWKLMIWLYVLCPDRILTKRYLAALGIFNTVVASHQTAPRLLDFQISINSAVEVRVYGFLHNGFLLCKFSKVIFEGFLHTQHRIAKFLQRWRLSGCCKDLLICRFSWFYGRIKT